MKRPYLVDVTETLHREVIVWAEGPDGAFDIAYDLCNCDEICLGDGDCIGREITIGGEAQDLRGLEQYGAAVHA